MAHYPKQTAILAYGDGGFRFADGLCRGSLLSLPSGMYDWPPTELARLTEDDFTTLAAERAAFDIFLFGTGPVMVRPPAALMAAFARWGLTPDWMESGAAVRTHNLLIAEGRRVAAALLLVP